MAPGVGIEPTIAESKSVVLPLHYPGINFGATCRDRTYFHGASNRCYDHIS
jgi:hypothetical protein